MKVKIIVQPLNTVEYEDCLHFIFDLTIIPRTGESFSYKDNSYKVTGINHDLDIDTIFIWADEF